MGDFKTCGGCFHYLMVCISKDKWQSVNARDGSLRKLLIRKFSLLFPSLHPSLFSFSLPCKIPNSSEFHLSKRHDISCFKNLFEPEKTFFNLINLSHFFAFLSATLFLSLCCFQVVTPLRLTD